MSWSARRRLLYLLGALIVLGAIGAGLYFYYKPAPSCTDGLKNQDEIGVDCGGSCPKVCPTEIQDPRIIWSRVFRVDEGKYDTATFIENPNLHYAIKNAPYIVRVLDANNILITTVTGSTFLNPHEQFIVFNSRLNVGQRLPAKAIFEWTDSPVWQKVDAAMPALATAVKSFTNQPRPQLLATVTNNGVAPVANLEVVALLSDAQGNALAVSSTVVETLAPGATREIAFTWPQPLPQEPATIDLYPHAAF